MLCKVFHCNRHVYMVLQLQYCRAWCSAVCVLVGDRSSVQCTACSVQCGKQKQCAVCVVLQLVVCSVLCVQCPGGRQKQWKRRPRIMQPLLTSSLSSLPPNNSLSSPQLSISPTSPTCPTSSTSSTSSTHNEATPNLLTLLIRFLDQSIWF